MKLTQRLQPRRYQLLLLLVLAGSSAIAVVVGAAAVKGSSAAVSPPGLGVVSAPVSPAMLPTRHDRSVLQRFGRPGLSLTQLHMVATRFGRQYFRVYNTAGPDCFGLGTVGGKDLIGALGCAPDFPSASLPVLDFTGFRQARGDPSSARITRSEGFAADGVAEIAFRTADGHLVGVTPVIDNVYVLPNPPQQRVVALVARDQTGATVWTQDYPPLQ